MKSRYVGKRIIVDAKTGDRITTQVINARLGGQWWRANVKMLLLNLGDFTNKSWKVVSYLLDNLKPQTNCVLGTNRSIAKNSGVGYTTVSKTLKFLKSHNLIIRKTGAIMFNPAILANGSTDRIGHLLINYDVATGKYKDVSANYKANQKRTAKARRVRNATSNDLGYIPIYYSKSKAKRHHAGYQQKLFSRQNKKASQG